MKLLKQSTRNAPKVSLILLDWSVRESFHLLHYLGRQNIDRSAFEIIVVEYYSRVSQVLKKFEGAVDTWILLEMPERCYYHKHLMYNVGIVSSRGEICVICDSDAMVKETFIRSIAEAFEREPSIVLHLDQFRNTRRDFYPFNYPSFEQVLGDGCINNVDGKTKGLVDEEDPLHSRNYGACMCARHEDLIAIGGADEHIDYLGHICGPYDMTFRLVNKGLREVWHASEFMYHTWHPGQAGVDNYLGPHDGRHVSTTALQALCAGRVQPYVKNAAIAKLQSPDTGIPLSPLIDEARTQYWDRASLKHDGRLSKDVLANNSKPTLHRGFEIDLSTSEGYVAGPAQTADSASRAALRYTLRADSVRDAERKLVASMPQRLRWGLAVSRLYTALAQSRYYCSKLMKTTRAPHTRSQNTT